MDSLQVAPFGGIGFSGLGREGPQCEIDECAWDKLILGNRATFGWVAESNAYDEPSNNPRM